MVPHLVTNVLAFLFLPDAGVSFRIEDTEVDQGRAYFSSGVEDDVQGRRRTGLFDEYNEYDQYDEEDYYDDYEGVPNPKMELISLT